MRATTADAYKLFHEGALALAQVEANGIRIDVPRLQKMTEQVTTRIKKREETLKASPVYRLWKRKFGDKTKLGAPDQLAKVLHAPEDKGGLGLPVTYVTSGGSTGRMRASTNKVALERIDHPFVKEYMRYRALLKVKSTYLGGIARELVGDLVRPVQNLHTVRTYRSSQDHPNGQNIPTRNEEQAELVRSCIVPRDGNRIIEIDFKGAEVSVAACYHQDPAMLEYCRDASKDMHRDMAAKAFLLKKSQVSKMTRYVAKNMLVFPFFYGSVWFQCAPAMWEGVDRLKCTVADTEITVKEHLASRGVTKLGDCDPKGTPTAGTFAGHLRQVEEEFWGKRFPVYKQWKEDWYAKYRRRTYFDMLTGFRCSGLYRRNEVTNYPVQGAAFHCLLWCLIQIHNWLRKNKMRTIIVGQIHDSMLLDTHPKEFADVIAYAKHVMTVLLPKVWRWIIVPINVEIEASPVNGSWFEKKPVE